MTNFVLIFQPWALSVCLRSFDKKFFFVNESHQKAIQYSVIFYIKQFFVVHFFFLIPIQYEVHAIITIVRTVFVKKMSLSLVKTYLNSFDFAIHENVFFSFLNLWAN